MTISKLIRDLSSRAGDWLKGSGTDADVVISSRIRLARNLEGYPFLPRLEEEQALEIVRRLTAAVERSGAVPDPIICDLRDTPSLDRLLLVERHLISRELANGEEPRSVIFSRDEVLSLMINEEDHLRIQVLRAGLELDELMSKARSIDDRIEHEVRFSYSNRLGYLTSCPTNTGTGMRLSVMLHLPALVFSKEIERVFQAVSSMNLTVRGLYGEGTQATGDFYQVSNQVTLGKSEEDILDDVRRAVPRIVKAERDVRDALLAESRTMIEDKAWRALGTLRSARTIGSEESMEFLSIIRMGAYMGVLPNVEISSVNELFLLVQPGHVQNLQGRTLKAAERDRVRSELIRSRLGG
ncbi:MAG: protein arginine kinase [Planctomycetota bacterium]